MNAQGRSNSIQSNGRYFTQGFSIHPLDGLSIHTRITVQSSHAETFSFSDFFNFQAYHEPSYPTLVVEAVYLTPPP